MCLAETDLTQRQGIQLVFWYIIQTSISWSQIPFTCLVWPSKQKIRAVWSTLNKTDSFFLSLLCLGLWVNSPNSGLGQFSELWSTRKCGAWFDCKNECLFSVGIEGDGGETEGRHSSSAQPSRATASQNCPVSFNEYFYHIYKFYLTLFIINWNIWAVGCIFSQPWSAAARKTLLRDHFTVALYINKNAQKVLTNPTKLSSFWDEG